MATSDTVAVTGASGFIGRALCDTLAAAGRPLKRIVRVREAGLQDAVAIGDMGPATDWRGALEGARCVVHLAARTHVMRESAADPLAEYRRANVESTVRLAREAAAAGVRRLVFMSSIKEIGRASCRERV